VIPPKRVFGVLFEGFPCNRPTGQELRFSTFVSSIRGKVINGVPTPNGLFVRLSAFRL